MDLFLHIGESGLYLMTGGFTALAGITVPVEPRGCCNANKTVLLQTVCLSSSFVRNCLKSAARRC